jgi:hypothetical protein
MAEELLEENGLLDVEAKEEKEENVKCQFCPLTPPLTLTIWG